MGKTSANLATSLVTNTGANTAMSFTFAADDCHVARFLRSDVNKSAWVEFYDFTHEIIK